VEKLKLWRGHSCPRNAKPKKFKASGLEKYQNDVIPNACDSAGEEPYGNVSHNNHFKDQSARTKKIQKSPANEKESDTIPPPTTP
jgi:hypothetical protein